MESKNDRTEIRKKNGLNKPVVEDLIAPSVDTNKRTINDIPDLLAAGNKKTFPVGPPSDSKSLCVGSKRPKSLTKNE